MTSVRIACCVAAQVLCCLLVACGGSGGSGDPGSQPGEPGDPGSQPEGETPSCGVAAPLSPVGAAMSAAAPDMLAQCAGLPDDWLTATGTGTAAPSFDPDGVAPQEFVDKVVARLLSTRSSFELASLNRNALWQAMPDAIKALNDSLTARLGKLPQDQKPVLRFLYANPQDGDDPSAVFQTLTARLAPLAPSDWNVRVVVRRANPQLNLGWNHSKLVIVDQEDVTTTSFETDRYELALRLTGDPAALARRWFEEVWARNDARCHGANLADDCTGNDGRGPTAPPALFPLATPLPTPRAANVLSLPRGAMTQHLGQIGTGLPWVVSTADDALFAGIDAAQERVFLLQPGLNPLPFLNGLDEVVSLPLVDHITLAVALRGVDAKIVWGFLDENHLDPGWQRTEQEVEHALLALYGMGDVTLEQAQISRCMIRTVPFNGDGNAAAGMSPPASHAKLYMLDDGFYVGSQNLYPSELRLGVGQISGVVLPELDDHGFFVDASVDVNHDLTDEVTRRIVAPTWDLSAAAGTVRSAHVDIDFPRIDCNQLPHAMRLDGTLQLGVATFACSTGATAVLDFNHVTWDEIARVTGTAVCHEPSSNAAVPVTFQGSIAVGGRFHGTVTSPTGSVGLDGTWSRGSLALAFGAGTGVSGTLVSGNYVGSGSGSSWGDPHLVTLDGVSYDLQAAGEFVAVESATAEPFTIQVRQQPWGTSRIVAVNTAVAMRVGDDRLGVYAGRPEPLLVNGADAPMVDGQRLLLAGGGLVTRTGATYAVDWPAGTGERVEIRIAGDHLDLRLAVPPFRRGGLRGLYGDFDGDGANDVATRGAGAVLLSPSAADFFGVYAASWRLSAAESLFDYAQGESTATFTDLTFPDQAVTARQLTDEQRAAAQLVCAARGVTDPILLEACILDVAVTGDATFAEGAAATPPPASSYALYVNLAAGRPVTVAGSYGGGGPQVITDGVFAPEGTVWNDPQYAITIPGGTTLTLDLGAVYSIHEVVAQVDNNDSYLVETSTDGADWSPHQVAIPSWGGGGLRTRPAVALDPPIVLRYVRIQAASGDGMYSASELELRGPTTPVGP